MALYQDSSNVFHKADPIFDQEYTPGVAAPYSGIYMCVACKDEAACNKGNPLPPQNHRQHNSSARIRWKLLVQTQNGPG